LRRCKPTNSKSFKEDIEKVVEKRQGLELLFKVFV
jgi:hypothetical protein